jgi:hypothetical protein
MMPKFGAIDYSDLDVQLDKHLVKQASYKVADVKDQLETVSWDIVRFKDNDKGAELWQVQSADDGDYIVALYDEDEEATVKTASANWSVLATKTGHLQISYKGDPLVRLSSAQLGIPVAELKQAEKYLPEKLATNPKLVKTLLKELPAVAQQEVSKRYPELKGV